MVQKTINEILEKPTTHLWFVSNKETDENILGIMFTINCKYASNNDGTVNVSFVSGSCDSSLYPVRLAKWIINNPTNNKDLLLKYLRRFENINEWFTETYEPKWKNILKDDFYNKVIDYLKNDLYLFCNSFDNLSCYESFVNGDKTWIKE